MSGIRFKLIFVLLVTALVVGGTSYTIFKSFQEYTFTSHQISMSYNLEKTVEELQSWRFSEEDFAELRAYRQQLSPPHRMEALSDVIQAYSDKNARLLKSRTTTFIKNEQEYRKYLNPKLTFLEEKIQYYGSICLAAIFTSLLLTLLTLHHSVFSPIKELAKKMVDFLHDRYTYQFTVPAPNEVGNLQATFNSLAQRVLSHMEELQTLDRAKSDFLSIASHELRTPLTSIKGSLSLLKSGVVGDINPAATNLLNIAENETDRLIRLINDLLDLAKIESGRLPLSQQWGSFNRLIHNSIESLQGLAQTAQVELVCDDLPPLEVYMDKDRVQQVLTNLISNAIKYSPQQGQVRISCEIAATSNTLEVQVIDQGKGIAPEDQELIFQKFRQATSPQNPLVKGTGLGLAIAKALVEEHSGEIGVRSQPGKGSVFYFTLGKWRFTDHVISIQSSSDTEDQETGLAA